MFFHAAATSPGADMPLYRGSMNAQCQLVHHPGEQFFLEFAAGLGIADDADLVPRGNLRLGHVPDMPEDSADR